MNESPQTEVVVVQSGLVQLFDHYEDKGPMWLGQGDREVRKNVVFGRPFLAPPSLHVSLAMADGESSTNTRFDLITENVRDNCFDIVFKTWMDSRWARIRVSWMAIGNAIREEYWVDF